MAHVHDHAYSHSHGHTHGDDDYFVDQLCLLAITGAFGAICLTMFFWKTVYLKRILAEQFFDFILWSGIALLVLFVIRAVVVWRQAGVDVGHGHDHAHHHHDDHHHAHGHDHHHHHHEHGHLHHDHDHDRVHEHLHADFVPAYPVHADEHGHEHGFAPWRYVVLIVPIVLFFLDLPREKKPRMTAINVTQEVQRASTVFLAGPNPVAAAALLAPFFDQIDRQHVTEIDFKYLEAASYTGETREQWEGKAVAVTGQFSPSEQNRHFFGLVRFRIQCCVADAVPLNVVMICNDPVTEFQRGEWVKVTGRIEFQKDANGRFHTVLRVPQQSNIEHVPAPANPYLQ